MGLSMDTTTLQIMKKFNKTAPVTRLLSSFFTDTKYFNSEAVTLDIKREDEEVAVAVSSLSTGYNFNEASLYTNKQFIPPIFKEGFGINAFNGMNRQFGDDPFKNPDYKAAALEEFIDEGQKVLKKIKRAIELQASQVLQTGKVTLYDKQGNAIYDIDYKPNTAHFPTASIHWDDTGATMRKDLGGLADVIRDNGLGDVKTTLWGADAFEAALNDTDFMSKFDGRRVDIGAIVPMRTDQLGAQYRGTVEISDNYKIDIFTYNGRYIDPASRVKTKYINPRKIIMMIPGSRLQSAFGGIPRVLPPDPRVLPFLPQRTSSGGTDMFWNAWATPEGEQVQGGVGSRPMMLPVDIDSFGCLDTGIGI